MPGTDVAGPGAPRSPVPVLNFLARVSRHLAESLDYERTLVTVAGSSLPYLGSWCIVDVVETDGSMRRVGIIHPDPAKQEVARRLKVGWPPRRDDVVGVPRAMVTRETEVVPQVSDEMLVQMAREERNLHDLRALGIGSIVVVPLIARGEVLGALTFVSSSGGRCYSEEDVTLAEDISARAAVAIDHARLFREAEAAREAMKEARDRAANLNERLVLASLRQQELADEAREANRAKSQFLANMSHEIRTPINAIVGYAELLEMEVAGPTTLEQREYLERLRVSGRHLIRLIDDVLDLSKVEAGRMRLNLETLSAERCIASAVALIESQAELAGVTVEKVPEGGDVALSGDEDRVRQILAILLNNAVKFTDRGGRVRVRHGVREIADAEASLERDGPWAYIQVEDTGIGISEKEKDAVFQPFTQGGAEGASRQQGGTGLGLAIALELARRMGGDLTVRSEEREGSCFTLWLPSRASTEETRDVT